MSFIEWVKKAFEGNDGIASSRSLTNVWYVVFSSCLSVSFVTIVYIILLSDKVNENTTVVLKMLLWLILVYLVMVLLLFSVVTIQQVIQTAKAVRGEKDNTNPIEVISTTETKIKTKDDEKTITSTSSNNHDIG